jgi:predicted LPLAT superfamily acyltransferase
LAERIGPSLTSTRPPESQAPEPAIVDTVVFRYFLLVERFELLLRVLGQPLMVSRIVYDPENAEDEQAMSEIVRSIHVQRRRAADRQRTQAERDRAELLARRLAAIHEHFKTGSISIADMSEAERSLYGRLGADEHASEFDLKLPLDDGEAASLAIASERGWVFASDDNDALRAMRAIHQNHPYQRIRKILIEAAGRGLISRSDANAIHTDMGRFGFWDKKPPFSEENI